MLTVYLYITTFGHYFTQYCTEKLAYPYNANYHCSGLMMSIHKLSLNERMRRLDYIKLVMSSHT